MIRLFLTPVWQTPIEGVYHFDPVKTEFGIADPLRTQGSTFEMIVTKDAVGDFEAIFETLEVLPSPVNA